MNTREATRLCQKLGALFQPLNQEQAKLAMKEFSAYSVDAVDRAIEEHRRSGGTREGFVDWRQLFEGCRAADAGESNAPRQVPAPSLAEVVREQWPQVRDRGDCEVLLRYWRADWWRYEPRYQTRRQGMESQRPNCAPEAFEATLARMEAQRRGYAVKVGRSAEYSLVVAGMDVEAARIAAASVFDPPEVFRLVLDDLRQHHPGAEPALPI